MLKPAVQVGIEDGVMVAEFWDCLRLDPAPVQDLRKKFETHVNGKGRADLIVNLNGVGYAGSAALGVLLAIHRFAKQHNGRMIFCNVDPMVLEVFIVSKLENLFSFARDKAAAKLQHATATEPVEPGTSPRPAPAPSSPSASPTATPLGRPASTSGGLRGRLRRDS